jgi:hypothetical protein
MVVFPPTGVLSFAPCAASNYEFKHLLSISLASPDHGAVCHDRGGSCCNQGHGKITGSQVSMYGGTLTVLL